MLVVGASRTIGLGLAEQLLRRGWTVIGTVRGTARTALHDLADRSDGRLTVERLEMTDADSRAALRDTLAGTTLDLLLVSAAITNGDQPIGDVDEATFTQVMTVNAYAPLRVVETLLPLVSPTGTIGVLSSSQGSLTLNTRGGHEVYRASKSALNQLMRSFAARHAGDARPLLLLNPGWVRTELGGPEAPLSIDQSVPGVIDTVLAQHGTPGLRFLDHRGQTVPW
ncbi:SDR family oxidoreductase [Catenuloplanes sp. NPDC051500]|uniref:SDR family oxidoreductase n=1 Tax=Catenuloplanes sp. NPDC051500 TaxID=3363959 RepID=UPI0037B8A664